MRTRVLLPLLTATACLVACGPEAATTTPDDAAAEPTATADAGPSEEEKKAAEEAKAEEERQAKLAARFKELEEKKTAEAARWTDEMKADAKKLVEKKHKNTKSAIAAILKGSHRSDENKARDEFRHPAETLAFFGIKHDMTVVEVGPGGGWYTEILAPLLAKKGKLVATNGDPNGPETEGSTFYARRFQYFLDMNADLYGKVEQARPQNGEPNFGAAESADAVLIIRGLHGQARRGVMDKTIKAAHAVLKPGGTLGIVQHRAAEGTKMEDTAKDGYLAQEWLVEQVTAQGFELAEASEINANDKDTKDHPDGVWSLPPTLSKGDEDADKYKAIGESDRMTLRFVKK